MLTLVWGLPPEGRTASDARYYGCTLPEADVDRYYKNGTDTRLYITGDEEMIPRSGNSAFDSALARTLAKISDLFGVLPGFAYYDDHDGANAYATPVVRMAKADGTVLFGERLLRRLMAGKESPDAAVAAVCAHEFGHIVQYKLKLDKTVSAGETTTKRIELQADYFAGYFAGVRKLERPGFPAAVFAMTQFNFGDNMIQNPGHHGTPDERAAAISKGFEVAYADRRSFQEAIHLSVNYVSQL